jgi:hypothetical protein
VKDHTVPIEVAAHSEHPIHVFWLLSTDDWDRPKYFVVGSLDTRGRSYLIAMSTREVKAVPLLNASGTVFPDGAVAGTTIRTR